MTDLMRPHKLRAKLRSAIQSKNEILARIYAADVIEENGTIDEFIGYGKRLQPYITDTSALLNNALDAGKTVLFEGAQGTLLDVDHGTYPFVTSSNTTAGAASVGSGIGPLQFDEVMGIAKAYTTRVGSGPFPTELFDQAGEALAREGHEFGATTGRPRRCGWFDAVNVKHACRLSGVTALCITKLDVLDQFTEVKICTAYQRAGKHMDTPALQSNELMQCVPVYERVPGWRTRTAGIRTWQGLPGEARRYLERLSELIEVSVDIVSTGADRDDTLVVRHPFD